jgi:hypothetical protein
MSTGGSSLSKEEDDGSPPWRPLDDRAVGEHDDDKDWETNGPISAYINRRASSSGVRRIMEVLEKVRVKVRKSMEHHHILAQAEGHWGGLQVAGACTYVLKGKPPFIANTCQVSTSLEKGKS